MASIPQTRVANAAVVAKSLQTRSMSAWFISLAKLKPAGLKIREGAMGGCLTPPCPGCNHKHFVKI